MNTEFYLKVSELLQAERAFATATVIKTTGSASAKPGAKSIISESGESLLGWVGGGCADSEVRSAALEALQDGKTRIIEIDLDDEVLGVGMPCGGMMDVYIEPYLPQPELMIVGAGRIAQILAELGRMLHFNVTVNSQGATQADFPFADKLITDDLDYSKIEPRLNSFVIVVTQHKGDREVINAALKGSARYVGLVASAKRAGLVVESLKEDGLDVNQLREVLHAPCGLDLGGRTPEEIALSIITEVVKLRHEKTGLPIMEVKQCSI
jgi:xanthine dehydrogenase accessory factor